MNIKQSFLLVTLFLVTGMAFGQSGIIRGKVIDDASGEELIGVTVMLKGTTKGSVTDFDGVFQIKAEPGDYDVQVSFVSFKTTTITGVKVNADQVTLLDGIRLKESVEELDAVVVTASVIKNSETALLTVKKKSANLLDGISAQNFRKIGDGNAAAAVKRVPGVSIEGGKYVYVRGLGDRYTKSILNGMDIPGLDPDRNTLQMDIFPTNIIDNIVVMKSFTAELGADFTGGVVDIATKDFPEEKTLSISAGIGYNPQMHFNADYLSYKGGDTDFLGFDDGTRDIPTAGVEEIPQLANTFGNPEKGQQFRGILEKFNPTLAAMRTGSLMDYSFGLSAGNQRQLDKVTIGYNLALTYKNSTEYYEDAEYNSYGKKIPGANNPNELIPFQLQKGDFGVNNVLLGGLAGFAVKTNQSKYKLNLLHLQNGESKAGIFEYLNRDQGANFNAFQHNLEYSERSLTNLLISGNHHFMNNKWELEWKLSPTRSTMNDPDIRYTRYRTDSGGQEFTIGTESGPPERIWRSLNEDNLASAVNIKNNHELFGRDAKLKFGGGHTYKHRDYRIENFQISPDGDAILTGDPNELFQPENLWSEDNSNGLIYSPLFYPSNPNQYDANIHNSAAYVSTEFSPTSKLKTILGVRAENYLHRYTGENQQGEKFNNEKVLESLDLFPSVNVIYSLTENQNLRLSFSQTVARPSFKEASYAEIIDPLSGRTFVGGFFTDEDVSQGGGGALVWDGNLRQTGIQNFDIRWETFHKRGQTVSLSGFFKSFDDPIEMVQFAQIKNSFQPRNVGDGRVMGVELEARQNLDFIASGLRNLSITANVTLVESSIDMSITEFKSRQANARQGEQIEDSRDMAGQAPYILNLGLMYDNNQSGLEAGFYYNVQGPTLQYVGIANRPDVYTVPFHGLNFNLNKTLGANDNMRLGLKVNNILDDYKESMFRAYEGEDQFFNRLSPGRTLSLSFGYSF